MNDLIKNNEALAKIEREGLKRNILAQSLRVQSTEDIKACTVFICEERWKLKTVEMELGPLRDNNYEGWQMSLKLINKMNTPTLARIKMVQGQIDKFNTKTDQDRRDKELKLQNDAKKREDKRKANLYISAENWAAKGNQKKAKALIEEANTYFEPVPTIAAPPKTLHTESGKITKILDIEVIYNTEDVLRAILNKDLPVSVIGINQSELKKAMIIEKTPDDIKTKDLPGITCKVVSKSRIGG